MYKVEETLAASILAKKAEGKNINTIMAELDCKKRDVFVTYRKNNILSNVKPTDEVLISNIKSDKDGGMVNYELADKYNLNRLIIKQLTK